MTNELLGLTLDEILDKFCCDEFTGSIVND